MRSGLAALLCAAALACGGCSDACDDAADKLDECGIADEFGITGGDCHGATECVANCYTGASCDEIEAFEKGSEFYECLAGCD
jgi:hypothetical protein